MHSMPIGRMPDGGNFWKDIKQFIAAHKEREGHFGEETNDDEKVM